VLKTVLAFTLMLLLVGVHGVSFGQEESPSLNGIEAGMKHKDLIDSWGFPAKRDKKSGRVEIWCYLDKNTPHPTDGIVVRLDKGLVESWRIVENIYTEMRVWGKDAASAP